MNDQEMMVLLKEAAAEIDKLIKKKEEEMSDEDKVREYLANPKSQEDYMKNLEILHLKLSKLLAKIEKIQRKAIK